MTAFVLGMLVGLIPGLTGAGGGILAVPALTLGLGWSMTQASPVALVAVGAAAAMGAIDGFRRRLTRLRAALLMSTAGILVAPFGRKLAHLLPENYLIWIFSAVMWVMAWRLYRGASGRAVNEESITDGQSGNYQIDVKTGRIAWSFGAVLTLALIGAVAGGMAGLLGVGGGFVIVPALLRYSNISVKGVVATSLMVVALISNGTVAITMLLGRISLPLQGLLFIAGAVGGMLVGRAAAEKLPAAHMQRIFALVMVAVSFLLIRRIFT